MTSAATAHTTRIFRAMLSDATGKPLCGDQANMLGVRPRVDITPSGQSKVVGGKGGMSVTPDDPARLPPHVRPARLGGQGRLPVFGLLTRQLGERLVYRPDPGRATRHGFVEPVGEMQLAAYQGALAATQPSWEEFK